jgi:hypothetical protein
MKLQKKLKTIRGFSTGLNLSIHAKKRTLIISRDTPFIPHLPNTSTCTYTPHATIFTLFSRFRIYSSVQQLSYLLMDIFLSNFPLSSFLFSIPYFFHPPYHPPLSTPSSHTPQMISAYVHHSPPPGKKKY